MPELSDEEFLHILSMDRDECYAYSIETIAASSQMWWLRHDNNYAIQKTADGGRHLHIWPHCRLAENAATKQWENFTSTTLELGDFYRLWYPDMLQTGQRIIVCFIEGHGFLSVTAEKLDEDLRYARSSLNPLRIDVVPSFENKPRVGRRLTKSKPLYNKPMKSEVE